MGLKTYLGLPQWLTNLFTTTKVRKATASEVEENKMKQKALRGAGHKEIKIDGSWGPYQQKLWNAYKKKHPEGVNAVFDLAPSPVRLRDKEDSHANFEHATRFQSNLVKRFPGVKDYEGSPSDYNQITDRYIKEIQDSINSRNKNGFYKREPEMKKRDQEILQRYKNFKGYRGKWSCINSVTGLYPGMTAIPGNSTFQEKAPSLGFTHTQTAQPNSIIQKLDEKGNPEHAVYNLGDGQVYNTHGFIAPFKHGNQIEPAQFSYKQYYQYDDGTPAYDQWDNKTENFYDSSQNLFWRK